MSNAHLALPWSAASRYAGAVRWFARTLWGVFRWRVVGVVAVAQLGVMITGAGLSLSVAYFQQLEQDGELRLGGVTSLVARDQSTLSTMVVAVLALLLTGAAVLFLAQRRIVSMAVELNHRVRMDIALAYGGELPAPSDWSSEQAVRRALWLLQTRDARRVAIVARSLLRNTVNVGIAVVGLAALFYLEARMTLLFLLVMAVAMISYYRTNAASARATRRYEVVAPRTRQGLRQLLPSFQTLSHPAPDRVELEAALDSEAVAEETSAFGERFGAHVHAEFLGVAIMGVALAGIIAFLGRDALAGTMPWTRLFAYVLVLRITLGAVQSLLRTFAFFSRFYPSIDRLNRFFATSNAATSTEQLDALTLRASASALIESPAAGRPVERGEIVEVLLPVPLSRYSVGLLASALAGHDRLRRRRFLGQLTIATSLSVPPVPASMSTLFNLDGGWDREALRRGLGDHAADVEEVVGSDPSTVLPAEVWAKLPRAAADRLVLASAAASPRPLLALDHQLATEESLARLRREADGRIIVVCGSAPGDDDRLAITRTLVVSPYGEIVAIGSPEWVARHWESIAHQGGAAPTDTPDGDATADADDE